MLVALISDPATMKKVAMLFFFAVFLGVVVYLILARPDSFREAARLPLDDDTPARGEDHHG